MLKNPLYISCFVQFPKKTNLQSHAGSVYTYKYVKDISL